MNVNNIQNNGLSIVFLQKRFQTRQLRKIVLFLLKKKKQEKLSKITEPNKYCMHVKHDIKEI